MTVDRSVYRKALVTLAIGGATFLVSNTLKQPAIWSFSLSIFVSGIALIVQFLAQFEGQLKTATRTFQIVASSALLRDPMIQLVELSTKLDPAAPELIHNFARSEVARASELMQGLVTSGDLMYDGEDRDWLLTLTRNITSSLDTTGMTTAYPGGRGFVDERLWTSDLGMRYLEAQRQAVQRGVRIHGISVRILSPAAIPSAHRLSMFDFTLFDDIISYELTAASPFEDGAETAILNTRLELRSYRVQERIQRFRDPWESAHDFK